MAANSISLLEISMLDLKIIQMVVAYCVVSGLAPNSAASYSGLRAGDVIVGANRIQYAT